MKKKLLAVATLVLAICLSLTVSVRAQDGATEKSETSVVSVTQDGSTKFYDRVDAALATVKDGAEVKLLNNISLPKDDGDNGYIIKNGTKANFTLDLNGHKITSTSTYAAIFLYDGSEITITDTSSEKNGEISHSGENNSPAIYIKKGTLKVNAGTIKSDCTQKENQTISAIYVAGTDEGCKVEVSGSAVVGNDSAADFGVFVQSPKTTVTVSGGTINGAIQLSYNSNGNNPKESTVNVTGGTINFKGKKEFSAIQLVGEDQKAVISGGTINSEANGVNVFGKNNEVKVSGGTLQAKDFAIGTVTSADQPAKSNYTENSKIVVTGGKVISTDKIAIYNPVGDVEVSGGEVSGKIGIVARQGNVKISGGTIKGTGTGTVSASDKEGTDSALPAGAAVLVDNETSGYEAKAKATITGGKFDATSENSVVSKGNDVEDFDVSGGAFNKVFNDGFIKNQKELEVKIGSTYYVGTEAVEAVKEAAKDEEAVIEVLQGNVKIEGAVAGVTVQNSGNGNVTVNGMKVTADEEVVVLGADDDKDPTPNTGIDVYAVAGAILVISALGVVVLNKRK